MGLFSSKRVTTVGTSIARLVADDTLTKASKTALIQSLFDGTDAVDAILESNMSNMTIKTKQMYKIAEKGYVFGMPQGKQFTNKLGLHEVHQIINSQLGKDVLIKYHRYNNLNYIHWGWTELIRAYGYNPDTNELVNMSAKKKATVYLKDMEIVIPNNQKDLHPEECLKSWGKPANSGFVPGKVIDLGIYSESYYRESPVIYYTNSNYGEIINAPVLRITCTWMEKPKIMSWNDSADSSHTYPEETFNIVLPALDLSKLYFQTYYSYVETTSSGSTVNKIGYWTYLHGSGTYSNLDALEDTGSTATGQYFPNLYFRLNKQMLVNTGTDANKIAKLKSVKKLTDKLGIDYEEVSSSIQENNDIADVEQAVMVYGIPADTTNQLELRYLFDLFSNLVTISGGSSGVSNTGSSFFGNSYDVITDVIQVSDKAMDIALQHGGITKERKVGVIGKIGTCLMGIGSLTKNREESYSWGDNTETRIVPWKIPYRYYQKQMGINLYDEIRVYNLSMSYRVWEDYRSTLGDNNKEIILLPLDKSITDTYKNFDQEELFQRSMYFVFNSRVTQKIKWYEKEIFGDLLKAAAIIATVVVGFSDGGTFVKIAAAVSTAAYATAAAIILTQIAISYTIKVAFNLFVKMVGVDLAFIAALVAAAYGMQNQLASGAKALTATAKEMLFVANGLVAGVNENIKLKLEDLLGDFKDFSALKTEQQDMLQDAEKLLESNSVLSPLMIVGESPTDFYNRTTHLGNMGRLLLDDVHNFVDRSLQLPRTVEFN